jgi:hypothetical protein
MDVSTKFGSAHGCAVRTGALKRDLFSKIKKRLGRHSFGYFSFAVERKVTRRQGRNSNEKSLNQALTSESLRINDSRKKKISRCQKKGWTPKD